MKIFFPLIFIVLLFSCQEQHGDYVCPPCDLPCDTLSFNKSGVCPHCKMSLILRSDLPNESALAVNEVNVSTGSGVFLIAGGKGNEDKNIKVHFYQPAHFTKESKILMVVPGAGRNGDSYRDAWKEEAEKYNVLILSPMFAEKDYSFGDYHLCGLMEINNLKGAVRYEDDSNIARLDEAAFTFSLNTQAEEWLFNDLDRIFDAVVRATGSAQTHYDLFGHSAGGQILHRLAIFAPTTKARHIVAANAGFYTLPDIETKMPFGINQMPVQNEQLKTSFTRNLLLLSGEMDNAQEQGGTLLRSETADQQGTHRLARAQYFYNFSKKKATEIGAPFNWRIEIVPNVGHDHKKMGDWAATLLYE